MREEICRVGTTIAQAGANVDPALAGCQSLFPGPALHTLAAFAIIALGDALFHKLGRDRFGRVVKQFRGKQLFIQPLAQLRWIRATQHQRRNLAGGQRIERSGQCSKDGWQVWFNWLPYSHIFARLVDHYSTTRSGMTVALAQCPTTVADDLKEIEPSYFSSVPRLLEKVWSHLASFPPEERAKLQKGANEIWEAWVKEQEAAGRPGREVLNFVKAEVAKHK